MKITNRSTILAVLLLIALTVGMWLAGAGQGQAAAQPGAANRPAPLLTFPPNYTPNPQATPAPVTTPSTPNWIGFMLTILCAMIFLMVLGIGAAILMVKLREKIR